MTTRGSDAPIRPYTCEYCGHDFTVGPWPSCPHCGRPALFFNVTFADREQEVLNARYVDALNDVQDRLAVVQRLETLPTQAVMNRSVHETMRVATSDANLYRTYYDVIDGGFGLPSGDEWDTWRSATDNALFPKFGHHLCHASLSIGEEGLRSYGDVSWALREDMIAHRASVFEENSVLWWLKNRKPPVYAEVPKGYRATWSSRGRLCAVKHAAQLDAAHTDAELAELLFFDGGHYERDVFVEVHVFGPITNRAIRKFTVSREYDNAEFLREFLTQKAALYRFDVA